VKATFFLFLPGRVYKLLVGVLRLSTEMLLLILQNHFV